jgi:hypothetical protein
VLLLRAAVAVQQAQPKRGSLGSTTSATCRVGQVQLGPGQYHALAGRPADTMP